MSNRSTYKEFKYNGSLILSFVAIAIYTFFPILLTIVTFMRLVSSENGDRQKRGLPNAGTGVVG